MKLSRVAGLTALVVLAVGQARAENGSHDEGLGFGIVRDLTPVAEQAADEPSWLIRKVASEGFLAITEITVVRNEWSPLN